MATRPRLNRAKAIREKCLDCVGHQCQLINDCTNYDGCYLWEWRRGEGGPDLSRGPVRFSRPKAIRMDCSRCMGGQRSLVNDCRDRSCPAWEWRRGIGQPEWTTTPLRRQTQKVRFSTRRRADISDPTSYPSETSRRVSVVETEPNQAISGEAEAV